MKKLVLAALFAVLGLAAVDASARHCSSGACETRQCEKTCEPCVRVIEACKPEAPCCERYVRVTEPACLVKHISYSWECPETCKRVD